MRDRDSAQKVKDEILWHSAPISSICPIWIWHDLFSKINFQSFVVCFATSSREEYQRLFQLLYISTSILEKAFQALKKPPIFGLPVFDCRINVLMNSRFFQNFRKILIRPKVLHLFVKREKNYKHLLNIRLWKLWYTRVLSGWKKNVQSLGRRDFHGNLPPQWIIDNQYWHSEETMGSF